MICAMDYNKSCVVLLGDDETALTRGKVAKTFLIKLHAPQLMSIETKTKNLITWLEMKWTLIWSFINEYVKHNCNIIIIFTFIIQLARFAVTCM